MKLLHCYEVTLLLTYFFVTETEGFLLKGNDFAQRLRELADKAGFSKIQDIYNSKRYSNTKLNGRGLVNEVASSLRFKFNGPIEAARKIRDAVQAEEDQFTSSPSMPECCQVHGTKYNSKFRTQVNTDISCVRISSTSKRGAKFPTSKVQEVMRRNFQDNPSLKWQYFASEDGHYLNYPALKTDDCGNYDPRFRPFYVETATPMPKDVVVILDRSGSMNERHNGKILLQIAKEAAISVVETLNPNDRVSVIAFETEAKILGASQRSCFNSELATATPSNKKFLTREINSLSTGSSTNYGAALSKAFDLFTKSTVMKNSSIREQVILFLTDGKNNEGSEPTRIIADRNKHLQNSVIVFTYALGNEFQDVDQKVLQDMANQVLSETRFGEVKKGQYEHITDPSNLRSAMASYYNRFSSSEQLTNAIFSVPYQDLLGIGLLTSVCLPVYRKSGSLFGVACSDITLEDLLSTLAYFQVGDLTYSFIIDGTGRTLMHPLMPQPDATSDDPLFIHIKHLERNAPLSEVIFPMMEGKSGERALRAKRTFPRGNVLNEGIETRNVEATYYWGPAGNSNFSLAVVVAKDDTQATLERTNNQKDAVHYHRLDLVRPGDKACKHFNRYAVKDYSTFMLTPKAFDDPFKYLDTAETVSDVNRYESFLKGETSTNPGLKPSVIESVITTYGAEKHWKTTEAENLVVWQYIGTTDGVLRLYPGATLPKNFDHTRRPWYLRTVAMKGKYVLASPYKDQWGSGYLITMTKTILQEQSTARPVMGVMGTDFRLTQFYQLLLTTYSVCRESKYRCFLIDNSGFIVIHQDFVESSSGDPTFENVHIVYKERAIADDMITNNYMTRSNCLDLEHIKNQFTYRVTTSGANRLSSYAKYQISPVPDSNVYIVIKQNIYIPPSSPCCRDYNIAPNQRLCVARQCDCICHTKMENFNYCLNEYAFLGDAAPTCSPQPPTLLPLPVQEKNLVKNLDVCVDYKCSSKSSKEQCNSIVGCDWCFRTKDGSKLSTPFCGTKYQCLLGVVGKGIDQTVTGCDNCDEEGGGGQ